MTHKGKGRVAILYPGDLETRRDATADNNRLAPIFQALSAVGLAAEPAVYHDDFCDTVQRQLLAVDAVLVWHNPIQDGRDRSRLDPMLRAVAERGIYVSAHPEVILKMGTKEVLYRTREMGWGSDTHLYPRLDVLREELPARLAGGPRVLKQYRGNGGNGVWRVAAPAGAGRPEGDSLVRVRHAKRGAVEERIPLSELYRRCEPYFAGGGRMIDQAYQTRLPEGMLRCYLVHGQVAGFGLQAVNALFPAPPGADPTEAPLPGPRLYHPPTLAEGQFLKRQVEERWVPDMQRILSIPSDELPILWDCDFLLGAPDADGRDTYVLCEINVSSVAPFPPSAPAVIAEALSARLQAGVAAR